MEDNRRLFELSEPIISINVPPLVDVSLVLVIIFMIFAPLQLQTGLLVKNAAASKQTEAQPLPEKIVLEIAADHLRINSEKIDEAQLPYLLTQIFSQRQYLPLLIIPDDEVSHDRLVTILDTAKASGAGKLILGEKTILGRGEIHGK